MMRTFLSILAIVMAAGASAATISGTVVDDGTGVPVYVVRAVAYDLTGFAIATAGIDVNGSYELKVPAGEWYVAAVANLVDPSDYLSQAWENTLCGEPCNPRGGNRIVVAESERRTKIDFRLHRPSGTITGRVTNAATGAPIPFSQVDAVSVTGQTTKGLADGNGVYRLGGLTPGMYGVIASMVHFAGISQGATVSDRQETVVDLSLKPLAVISGVVRDARTGKPVPLAVVERTSVDDKSIFYRDVTRTPLDGSYHFDNVTPGSYGIRVTATGYFTTAYPALPCIGGCPPSPVVAVGGEETKADIDLTPLGRLTGTVRDADSGEPIHNAAVRFGIYGGVSAADGTWSIQALHQPYQDFVTVTAPGYIDSELWSPVRPVAEGYPGRDSALDILLHRGGTFAGRLVDRDNGQPIAGAKISFTLPYAASLTAVTLGDGTFRTARTIAALPYTVTIEPPAGALFGEHFEGAGCVVGCMTWPGTGTLVDGRPGEEVVLELHAGRPGRIRVEVVDPDSGKLVPDPSVILFDAHGANLTGLNVTDEYAPLKGEVVASAGWYYAAAKETSDWRRVYYPGVIASQDTIWDVTRFATPFEVRAGQTTTVRVTATRFGVGFISPRSGPAGTAVTITGSGFAPTTRVTFDGVSAPVTDTTSRGVVVIAPPHADGAAVIELTEATGARVRVADAFVYAITGCVPAAFNPYRLDDNLVAVGATRFEFHPLGTPPFRFEWYRGRMGSIGTPAGTEPFLRLPRQNVIPSRFTGQYWLRVRNDCGEAVHGFALRVVPGRIAPR